MEDPQDSGVIKPQPYFCFSCGSLLGRKKLERPGYNVFTGKRNTDIELFCPRKKWWQIFHNTGVPYAL